MSIKSTLLASFAWACLIAATPASADVLLNYTGGTLNDQSNPGVAIQFGGGPTTTYSVTSFNWDTGSPASPYAYGTLYIIQTTSAAINPALNTDSGLSPNSLSTSTTGYIGSATASGGVYTFASPVTLYGGSTYYFFESGQTTSELVTSGTLTNTGTATAVVTRYRDPSGLNGDFLSGAGAYNFELQGTKTVGVQGVTPEPSSLVLLGTGGLTWLAHIILRPRRRQKSAA